MDAAIEAVDLSCSYGRTEAVRQVTFSVASGTLFALLGPNGAGKTTTIRSLMNILRPSHGRARVLGVDSVRLGPRELAQIGYVSENQKLPRWMTVADLLAFCRPFYPTWDDGFARQLTTKFELPIGRRIASLSRGMRVKTALVSALAFRPRVLVLDEPFSGLDPVVRDDLVHGVLELAGAEEWTVLISSHDLEEVERLVDVVGFMDAGHLVLAELLENLQRRFRTIDVTLDQDHTDPTAGHRLPPAWIGPTTAGRVVHFVETRYAAGDTERDVEAIFPGSRVEVRPMTLREIFVALVRQERARTGVVPQ